MSLSLLWQRTILRALHKNYMFSWLLNRFCENSVKDFFKGRTRSVKNDSLKTDFFVICLSILIKLKPDMKFLIIKLHCKFQINLPSLNEMSGKRSWGRRTDSDNNYSPLRYHKFIHVKRDFFTLLQQCWTISLKKILPGLLTQRIYDINTNVT